VSHQPERTEKDCLNCGTIVAGRYCQKCGQENIVTQQSFGSLTKHFIYDIFHFDGKFFDTFWLLFRRPGKVAAEYVKGRRVSYLDPIRMYLFTSAVFFLIFGSVLGNEILKGDGSSDLPLDSSERKFVLDSLQKQSLEEPFNSKLQSKILLLKDSSQVVSMRTLNSFDVYSFRINNRRYSSYEEYDSLQQTLPDSARGTKIQRLFVKKLFSVNNKYHGNADNVKDALKQDYIHRLPLMVFFSLPLFAILLKLLYRRRKFFYSDHAVFTLYQYIAGFILMLVMFTVGRLEEITEWEIFNFILAGLFIYGGLHLLFSMKSFYGQSWRKTILKFLLLNFLMFLVLLLLFVLFLLLSLYQL
jgi:hypothetical protein